MMARDALSGGFNPRAKRSGTLVAEGAPEPAGLSGGFNPRAKRSGTLVAEGARKPRRLAAFGLAATGLVCPCHALVGLVSLLSGAAILSPAVQDGIHAVYVPLAVLTGAVLLRRR
jgi:hypothetical protein